MKKYIEYFKDNPKGYWFKRKIYGWGWVPVKWQGWLVVLIFAAFLSWNAIALSSAAAPTNSDLFLFFANVIFSVVVLIWICYKKGEKPRWQWGIREK